MKKTALIVVVLFLVLVPAAFWWFCKRPVPVLDGRETIAGLRNDVAVKFDAHAVPYIEARDEEDAFAAQGYVTARERMFQMDMLRRSAKGEMSEIFGANALPTDRLVRTLGIRQLAQEEFNRLSPSPKAALDAYARGVNAYLSQNAGLLGLEFTVLGYTPKPWRAEDCLAILKYIGYKTDESWRLDDFRQRLANKLGEQAASILFKDDLIVYGQPLPKPKPKAKDDSTGGTANNTALLDDLAHFGDLAHLADPPNTSWGSTAFVVPKAISRSGGALLSCDKHGVLTTPAEWFLCSLNCPSVHAAGATIPGVPGVWVGRNEDICWGSAALKADVQDIYLEQFKSDFDSTYRIGNRWVQAEVRTELIPVRLGKDVEHKVLVTRHGPVLLRNKLAAISLSWCGSATDNPTFESLYKLNRAGDWQSFINAVTGYSDPPQMFVYADRYGNAGCHAAGLVPVRKNATQGTRLMVGTDEKAKWDGFIPFEKLPQAFEPAQTGITTTGGMHLPMIAANQRPASGIGLPQMPAGLILGHQWNAPYRANRLLATITNAKQPLSIADLNQLQGDEYIPVASVLGKCLADAAASTHYVDGNGLLAIDLFKSWDGQLKPGHVESSIYQSFMQTLARRLLEPTMGRDLATEYLQRWPMWLPITESVVRDRPPAWMPPEERTYDTFFLTTLTQSMKAIKISLSEPDLRKWQWGKLHQALFRHVSPNATPLFASFAVGPVPVGGSSETLNSCDVMNDPRALRYVAESGPTERMIVDMSDRDKFYQSLSTGQSGHRFSDYREDQLQAWRRVDLAPIAFSADQLVRQAKHRLTLENKYAR